MNMVGCIDCLQNYEVETKHYCEPRDIREALVKARHYAIKLERDLSIMNAQFERIKIEIETKISDLASALAKAKIDNEVDTEARIRDLVRYLCPTCVNVLYKVALFRTVLNEKTH